jgi:PAS domain S-box-containing protein
MAEKGDQDATCSYEADRLAALDRYAILDTGREASFDDIVELAAVIFEAPIAVVNLIADGRQWFKAEVGIGARELPLDVSICRHAILQRGVFVVPDLTLDPRFEANPLVTAAGGLRFYAGALLETPEGLPLGTVCVLDNKPRPSGVSEKHSRALSALASQTMAQLESRRSQARTLESERRLRFLDRLAEATQPLTEADEVMATTARMLAEHMKISVCAFADMEADEDSFTIRGDWAAPGSTSIVGPYQLADFGKLAVANLTAGLPLIVNDNAVELAPEEAATFQSIGIAATICMPLVKSGRLTALMAVHDRVPHEWTDDELSLVREVTVRSWAHVERVAALAGLRESEERLRLAVENAEVGFWDVDLINDVLIWPRRTKALFGISADVPVTMQDFYNGLHPDDRQLTSAAFAAAADPVHRALYDVEYRTIGKEDGATRWVAAKGRGVFDGAGRCLRVAGTAIDITARKRAEEALHALNADLEQKVLERSSERGKLWQVSPDLLSIIDLESGTFDATNPAWMAVLGWNPGEIHGRPYTDFVHPEDLDASIEAFQTARAGNPVLRFQNRYCTKDGGWRWLSWVALPENGKVYSNTRDVTAAKAREAELADRTAERDRMWLTSPNLLLVVGFDGILRRVNPAWTVVLGYNESELVGTRVDRLVHVDDLERTEQALIEASGGPLPVVENRYRHRDGSYRWISWMTAPPEDGMIYATGRDVTVEREAAAELEQAQEALRQSQKMEAMGQLTGGVAHDFNNLLTPIVGSLDMLQRKGVGTEREQRLIAGAMQSADRAKTLVQRLLAFARRQPLQASAVDIGNLVTGMADLVASTSGPQVKVVVDAAEHLPAAKADPNQLEMALLNLGVNARDAMPDGGTLRITADCDVVGPGHRSGLKIGEYVRLSVADTGVGMDEKTMKRAVEPFYSTKGVGKGTGLGLSMAHGLAMQLGGALTIQSRPGVGTNVELWLPVSAAPAELTKTPTIALAAERDRGTALLVDDEELVRMSTAAMLADMGFAVVEAASAEEALRILEGGLSADLIITDHLMPGMNGTDLARLVRSDRPDVRVLIVSGYAEAEGIDADLPRLTKPFREADLAAKLSERE